MLACRTVLYAPGCAAARRPGPGQLLQHLKARSMRISGCTGLALMYQQPAIASRRQQRSSQAATAAGSSGGGSGSSGGSGSGGRAKKKPGPKGHTAEPQPELQAWLEQQQGLTAAAADEYARRLAHVFCGSQQAALEGLPATFDFCAKQGLTGLETAQVLDSMAATSHASVTGFASRAQLNWLLIDGYIAAHVHQQQQTVQRLPKCASFGALAARSPAAAAAALAAPPGQVEAWLAAVGQQLAAEDIGRLLLSFPQAVNSSPETALAAMAWAVDELGVPAAEVADFMAGNSRLLNYSVQKLSANLAALQQTLQHLGLPVQQQEGQQAAAEQARRLVRKNPTVLGAKTSTVRAAAAWLQRLFPDPEQLHPLLERAPLLLAYRAERYERSAAYLQQELGWQPGDGQLAAFVAKYPLPFATLDFSSEKEQLMLRFLTGVVGVAPTDCLVKYSSYLGRSLETTTARYMLVQERAPRLLFGRGGAPSLSWVSTQRWLLSHISITKAELLAFEREWPQSEEGQRLLAALRSGSTEGWPRPGAPPQELAADTPARKARRQRRQAGRRQQLPAAEQ